MFRHRTAIPVPLALALLLIRAGQAPFSWTLVTAGVVLTTLGEGLRLWAVRHIGVVSRTRSDRLGPLVDTGPFARVRNPLYLGNLGIWTGFALAARLVWLAPIVAALLAAEYHLIVRWEERMLEANYGDAYRAYAARVPRWLPRPSTSSGRAEMEPLTVSLSNRERTFSWRQTFFSERGTLIAIAAGYLLLWLKARF